ncbi:MAG: ABC transporter ATP-binding protein [Conexibacter sp.]
MTALLELQDVTVHLPVGDEPRTVLRGISLEVAQGEAVGLVGESGSGKSMTARAIMRLLPKGARLDGSIRFDGRAVTELDRAGLRAYRGKEVAMVFQDARVHVNPVRTIGDFMTERVRIEEGVPDATARSRAIELLEEVRVSDAARRLHQYPHELSGGLLQRVMIASTLMTSPRLLLADEPTTALDVTTQGEVMAILDELRRERGMAMLFITHDLELAAAVCDRTAVMYAGEIVEDQPSEALDTRPRHPYTAGLIRSRPSVRTTSARLAAIPGRPLSAFEAPEGCSFAPRCAYCEPACTAAPPALQALAEGRVACRRAEELADLLHADVTAELELPR